MNTQPVLEIEMAEYENLKRLMDTSILQDFVEAHKEGWNIEELDELFRHLHHEGLTPINWAFVDILLGDIQLQYEIRENEH